MIKIMEDEDALLLQWTKHYVRLSIIVDDIIKQVEWDKQRHFMFDYVCAAVFTHTFRSMEYARRFSIHFRWYAMSDGTF